MEMGESRNSTQVTGVVSSRPFAAGSKSEHAAVMLDADDGASWVLRRQGGNAFRDEALTALVGKRIRGHGTLAGHTLILTSWEELPGEPPAAGRGRRAGGRGT